MRIAAVALLIAAAVAQARGPDPKLANGERLARRDCGECHAVGGSGDSPNPDAPRFRELGRRIDLDGLPRALEAGLMVGHPRMPLIVLGEDEIADLTAYLKHIQAANPL